MMHMTMSFAGAAQLCSVRGVCTSASLNKFVPTLLVPALSFAGDDFGFYLLHSMIAVIWLALSLLAMISVAPYF